jgi:D-glycerate 3-kinase
VLIGYHVGMSGERVQDPHSISGIDSWLKDQTRLSLVNRQSLAAAVSALLPVIGKEHKISIGIAGAPGSGKSTFAGTLAHCLQQAGVPCCLLSLDDYYLSQGQRNILAKNVHPRLSKRGVPGTHDLKRLLADFDRLRSGRSEGLRLCVFDKSTDDLAPENKWRSVGAEPQVILLEGWCIGASPPNTPEWELPLDEYGLNKSNDIVWLGHVHEAWRNMHKELQKRLQQLWYIRVPDWGCVVDWRWRQELELPNRGLETREDVENFLASFKGIFRHMQKTYPGWADQVLVTDRNHNFRLPD